MEAESKDVSSIQDEDILRRMWQQTEDFGRKKEIRAHMYKLREARLKEFYTSGEVLKDVQRSNSSPGLRDQHSKNPQWQEGPTHADSLADHSFLSLKSKEIRDSESPTRDVQYRNSRNRAAVGDNGVWTISANTEKSDDGKRVTSSRIATTQGSRPLDGGELSYAATNEQLSSVYADGDANNFTKCVGESSKTFAQQNVTVGDDKNYHSSKSATSSSSSKVVSHHSSTTGNVDFDDSNNAIQDGGSTTTVTRKIYSSEVPSSNVVQDGRTTTTVTRKVYSSDAPDGVSTSTIVTKQMKPDIPDDLKKSIADGNTKVITETKTLPDGSTVTTTRYETKGSKKWSSTTGSSQVITNRQVVEQKKSSSTIDNKHIEYVGGDDRDNVKRTVVVTKSIRDSINDKPGRQSYPEDYPDNINKTETVRIINSERNVYEDDINSSNTVHVKRTQDVHDQRKVIRRTEDVTEQDRKVTHKPDTHDDQPRTNETVKVTKIITRNDEDQFQPSQRKPVPESEEIYTTVTTTKTTVKSGVSEKIDDKHMHHHTDVRKHEYIEIPDKTRPVTYQPQEKEPLLSRPDNRQPASSSPRDQEPVGNRPDTREPLESRPHDRQPMESHPQEPMGSRPQEREPAGKSSEEPITSRPQDRQPVGSRPENKEPAGSRPDTRKPAGSHPQNKEPVEKYPEEPSSCRLQDKQPSRPQDIEFSRPKPKGDAPYKPSTPTDDQYTTTYRQEYVTKRISVDVSPTHDAFARSLRAISPDRMSDRPKSRGSLRTSTSSLRSSTSPEKTPRYQPDDRKQPSRMSPERKPTSDSPRKRTESPRKHSPERAMSPKKVTSPDRPRVSQSPDKKSPRTTGSPDRKPCTETVIRTTVTKTTTTGQPDKPYSTDTITRRKPDDRKSPEKQINSDTLPRKKTTPTQDYSPVRTPSPTKPSDSSSPSKTIPRNQVSPERPSPVRGTSPTKPADRSSPVRSPTKPSNKSSPPGSPTKPTSTTEIITINTDTLTRKKKIPTSEEPEDDKIQSKPVDQSSPIRSPTKTTETLIMTKTGTITKKTDSPTDDSPGDNTKPDKDSPTKPTDKNERIITETTTVTTKLYPDSPSDTKVPKSKKPNSRDSSPTCSASDIEFINHNRHIVTDLDEPCDNLVPEKRPTSLDIDVTTTSTTRKVKQVTDKSPSAPVDSPRQKSPVKDSPRQKSPTKSTPTSRSPVKESPTKEKTSPVKEVPKKNSLKRPTPEQDSPSERPPTHFLVSPDDETPVDVCERPKFKEPRERPPLIRTETYEKRCRKILGLPDNSSPDKTNAGREPIEEPEIIKQQKQPYDEYAGREPVDEPLFVKKHFDMHYDEDRLIQENVERITKHRPRNDDQPDDEDYPVNREPRVDKETIEFITSERHDTDVKKYRQPTKTEPEPVNKSNKDKPTDKIKRPSERKPEPDTTEEKPIQKIPTLERKSPEKQKYPDAKQPQQKKTKDGQTDDGEYITEYTDEYCERPVSKKPEQKIPKDNLTKTTVTETTTVITVTDSKIGSPTGNKPVRDNSSPDRKYPDSKLRQPSKKQHKEEEPDDRDFTTEYIDEYCEVPTDKDGDIPRKPGQKITKENVITAKVDVTKVTEVTDKKLTRQIPSSIRKQPSKKTPDDKQKRPQKQKPEDETDEETDEEIYTDEYNRTTEVITTEVTELEKPSDRKPIEYVRNKKPQNIESDKKPLRESPDKKFPKDNKPTEPKQKRPDEKDSDDEECVDEYHRTTKVTNIVNGRKLVDERPDRKMPEDSDTEMEPEDRNIPKEPKVKKTPSSKVTSTTTKTVKTITTTDDKKPVRESPSPDRKKPTQDKPRPNREQPDDVEEYNRITKVVDRKIPVRQSPSPDRKQPKKLRPGDTEPVTEYTDEYCNKPTPKKTDKITSKTTVETMKVVTSTDKTTKSVTKKPGSDGPVLDKKQPVQDKKKPIEKPDDDDSDDREFTNKYIDEYSEVTTKETKTQKKPSPVDKYSEPDTKPKASSLDRKSPMKDDKPSQKRPEVSRQSPSRDLPHKTTIITDLTDEYHITNRGVPESDKPYGRKPQTDDFINSEKYDTDITLEIVEHTRDHPEREPKPVKQIPDVHYDIENEVRQEEHIRTHRIDTTVATDEVTKETSPRRYPQKAVPTDTMECTLRKPEDISDDENVTSSRRPMKPDSRKPSPNDEKVSRKTKKPDSPEDRKTPVKQLKDTRKESLPKTITQTKTTKVITKKTSTPDVDTKRRVTDDSPKRKTPVNDINKRKSPNDEKIPKEKSPIRQERPKQRSPSPVYRTSTKKVAETERVVTTQITRKPSNKDVPIRKTPDLRGKITDHPTKPTTGRTPSESPIRKPLYTSPAASPERKPTTAKPSPKVPHKESTQAKPTEPSKKHVVTKTISLNRKPDTKPQVSPVKYVPKTITTVKTTKITQPSSVTVTTVKTTKTSKKTAKPKKVDTYSSDTESEPEIVDEMYDVDVITNKSKTTSVDKKKVITTAKINITSPNNVPKYQSPIRGKEPEITTPSYKVNASEIITITTNKTTSEPVTITTEQVTIMSQNKPLTKCITTKSIVLNKDEPIDQEIVIDLQRSSSSREPSPDKICPIPVSSEDETGYPRYPDQVSEPDDSPYRRKPQKISDIPLTEEEDVKDFNRITEVSEKVTRKPVTRISQIDKVTDTDESLLSVTEKVSRFITTAEKLTTDDQPKSKKPAPKVPRPELIVTDDLEDDECLLSVSDKVSKFITTAEHVSTKKHNCTESPTHKPKPVHDVQVEEDDDCLLSVNEKVTHFIEAANTIKQKPIPKEPTFKVPRPEFTDIDETLKTDECLLSVSDKVSKFLTTAEKLTTEIQTTKMEPKEKIPSRQPSPEKISPDTSKLRQSPARKTPERNVKKSSNLKSEPIYQEPTSKSPEVIFKKSPMPVTGVKQSTRPVSEPTKIIPSEPKPVNLKSSEAVRKAKAMFENINKSQEVPKQRDILSRPSVWEGRKKPDTKPTDQQPTDKSDIKLIDIGVYKKKEPITDVRKQLIYTSDEEEETCKRITTNLKDVTLKSTKLILNEKKSSTTEQVTTIPKYGSPERDMPGYMKPLGKHEHGSHEDIPSRFVQKPKYGSPERDTSSKFTQKPRHDSPDRDTPGYMRPIGTHRHPSHEDIPSKFSQKPRHGSPDRDMPSKLTQKPRQESPDRETPGYMRPLGKHEHPSHEDIPSKVAHKPRFSSPERDSPTKSTYRPRHSSPEGDIPGYMRPIGKHDSPRDDTPSKYTHKPRHSSPERDSYTRHEEVTIDKKTVLRSKQTPDRDVPGYMRPISKVSPEDRNKYIIETRSHRALSPERDSPNYKKSVVEHEEYETETRTVHRHRYSDDDDMPGYMRPLNRCLTPDRDVHSHKKTVVKEEEIIVDHRHRHSTPDRDVPGYMKPLQRHAHSPDRDSERIRDVPDSKRVPYRDDVTSPTNDDGPRAGKKFGVTLRRTDSGRMVTTATSTVTERRRSSTPGQPVIEDIQDLDVLERMMDKVVGYEQRRRIRSQIRVVRRLISENKIQYTTQSLDRKKPTKQSSPVREPLDKERRSPSKDVKKITSQPAVKKPGSNHNNLPEDKVRYQRVQEKEERKTEYKSSYTRDEQASERVTPKDRSMSPEPKKKPQTTPGVYKTDLKPVQPVSKVVSDDKPSWVTNRILKKTVTETATEERRNNVPLKKKETPRRSPSPQKEVKPIDCITSSYGIGPTDENGQPLFGIRALRKAAATDKVQVRGTVVTSQFYSENGKEPVGEVTVTKYSNNPKELEIDDEQISKAKGFASVTTTQKFGTRGAPTLKSVIDNKKAITDKQSEEEEIFKTTTTKVTRRGSVKALSQKFIENAVEISRNERQTYPKAGLILRTSSFKETSPSDRSSSRESSPGYQGRPGSGKISLESITSDSRNNSTSSATTRHTDETKTFLNSHTRVANAQEVITRMKNAEREERDDDSPEDKEARMLLNKFLGAQVLMSGMEPLLANKTASTTTASAQLVRKVQKTKTITSSTKDSGNTKPSISLTKRFQCPITPEVLEDIWDEQTLRLLLEQCTDYEERRHIRARLRQVMAEQEAVANVVASAVAERDGDADRTAGSLQGESLLLPLLQELLDKKGSQQHQQQQGLMHRSASSQSSEESATATVDSGTESGEDLRLLAVGLCDTMDSSRSAGVEPLGPGLLAEVQNALSRLAVSLQLESADVQMEPGKRQSLLQLVARLQANLVVPTKPPTERRPSGSHGRFAKHKNRQNRHTVGVSSEELAAARKLMEEVVLRDSLSSSVTPEYVPTPPDYTLQKQNSDGCVSSSSNQSQYRSVNFSPQATTPVKNATAKPFTFVGRSTPDTNYNSQQPSQPSVGFNKSVSEPSTPHDHNQSNQVVYREKNHGRQSLNLENVPNPYMTASESVRPVSECFTMDHNTPNINTWSSLESVPTQKANIPRHNLYSKQPEFPKEIQESETDDDSSTVKQSEDTDDNRQSVGPTPTQLHYVTDVKTVTRTITPVQDSMNNVSNSSISSRNSDYDLAREKEDLFNGKDLSSAQRLLNIAINDDSKTGNRFNTKKLKMKRANTIDIPKPLNFYVDDDDSDDSILDRDDQASTRRSNYLALRGPIRVGQGIKSNVPSFEPKTENDKKFMAFIQKHNNNNTNVTSLWCNKNAEPKKSAVVDQNWNRKFGNIKTVFEKEEDKSRPSSTTVSSAKQFWQSADDAVNAGRRSYSGPKVSKQGTRQLQSLFEQKQQEAKLPWTQTEHNNVVTGTLKVESNFKPIQNSQLIQGKNYKFVPQPLPVNKFSHAPMSAFKPPPKRTPVPNSVPIKQSCIYPTNTGVIKQPVSKDDNVKKPDPETPLFLYTPKQLEFLQSAEPQEETKPTSRAPWASGPGQQSEHRVLSLAASKFENPTSREVSPQPHRKPSKDKVYIPPILLNNTVDTYNQPLKQPYQPEHIPSKDLSSPYLVKNVQPTKHQVRKISGEYDHIPQTKIDINSGFRTPNQQIYKSSSDESNNSYVGKNDNIDPRDPVVQTVKQTVKKFSEDNKNDAKVIHKQYTEPGRRGNEEHMKVQMVNKADNSYKQPSRRMSAEYEHPIVADVHVVQQQSYQNPPQDYQQISQKYQSPPQNYQKVAQNYQSPPEDYQKIAQTYQSQSNDYQNAPQYYQAQYQTPDYQKLPQNYQDQNLQQTYQSQTASQKLNSTSMKPGTFEYPSSESSQSTAVTPDNLDELDINPFTEYKAVSKVMTGPVSQQAVTVTQKTPKRREDHDNAARNLQNVLKNISRSEDREEGPSRRSSRPSLSPNPSISYKNKSQSVTPTIESNQTSYQAQSQSQYANENNLKPEIPGRKMSCEERDISPNYASQTHYEQKPNYASQVQYSNKQYEPETAPSAFVPVNESTKVNIPNYGSQVQYSNKQYEQQTTPSTFKSVVKDTTYSSENTKMNTPSYASQYSNKQYEQRDTSAFKPVNEKSYQTENTKVATNKSNISNKQYEMESSKQKLEKVSGSRYHEKDTSQSVPSIQVNAKPFSMESLEINDDGESVVTTKLQIPVHSRIVQYNNTTNVQRTKEQVDTSNKLTTQSQPLSKSDSWQKLTTEKQQITAKPSPRASPRASPKARNILQKAKSSHSLAMPKQFEAGISRDEVEHKKKTVAAYFGASQPLSKTSSSSNIHSREERTKTQQSSINRTKTGHKMSTQSRSSGLSRSRTMSDVADMSENAVDIDEEFENIFQRIETTKKTFSEGPITTTQVSSTRVINSSRQVNKPISPFAKFRQLDKQNSLNSPPSSPRTPGGGSGAPLFKFTDPALSHSASTVKDRLLHWCQMKTKEYQNIKLENFSTCWADGLAFCALIHHFLPDAFDYHALTPQQRRHNFTLAFTVADEQAGIAPLLDVDDMVAMRRPDWKCVFTYVQSIYRRFKDED